MFLLHKKKSYQDQFCFLFFGLQVVQHDFQLVLLSKAHHHHGGNQKHLLLKVLQDTDDLLYHPIPNMLMYTILFVLFHLQYINIILNYNCYHYHNS